MQTHFDERGLDKLGYIINDCSIEHLQPEFKGVVDAVIQSLTEQLPNKIHSIYLYGSVARGTAVVGRSDLDVSVVFNHDISSDDEKTLGHISLLIPSEHNTVSKLDIDPGSLQQVLNEEEKFRWHFWLKHCCCCVWGEDLSQRFEQLKPDLRIALALNGDLANAIKQFEAQPAQSQGKVIGKKILRSAYSLVAHIDGSWYSNLEKCAQVATRFYPQFADSIQIALNLALGKQVSQQQILMLCSSFGKELVSELQRVKMSEHIS